MRFLTITFSLLAAAATSVLAAEGETVKIEITREFECDRKSKKGDNISVHYRGTLQDGGKQFDASYDRGQPLSFVLGQGRVIKGWDDNLSDMCIGDKRVLTIPPEFGYGDRAMGPIPAGSTLIFETELMGIQGVKAPSPPVEKTPIVSSIASEATEGVKAGIKSKIADATKVAKVVISDTDDDGQEHNEL